MLSPRGKNVKYFIDKKRCRVKIGSIKNLTLDCFDVIVIAQIIGEPWTQPLCRLTGLSWQTVLVDGHEERRACWAGESGQRGGEEEKGGERTCIAVARGSVSDGGRDTRVDAKPRDGGAGVGPLGDGGGREGGECGGRIPVGDRIPLHARNVGPSARARTWWSPWPRPFHDEGPETVNPKHSHTDGQEPEKIRNEQ